jgi:hypothetical protein
MTERSPGAARFASDSLLEEDGFELSVPRADSGDILDHEELIGRGLGPPDPERVRARLPPPAVSLQTLGPS